jgi:hypothetical protein
MTHGFFSSFILSLHETYTIHATLAVPISISEDGIELYYTSDKEEDNKVEHDNEDEEEHGDHHNGL